MYELHWETYSETLQFLSFSLFPELKDQQLIDEWYSRGILAKLEGDLEEGSRFTMPQVLIDGVSIGDMTALQDLEEDGDLGRHDNEGGVANTCVVVESREHALSMSILVCCRLGSCACLVPSLLERARSL